MDAIKQFYALPVAVWETAVEEPDPAKRWAILAAVTNYAFYGVEPEAPTGIVKVVFCLQKPVIDKSKNLARFGNKNADKTPIKRRQNADETQKNAPLNKNKNKTKNENENENVRESALIDEIGDQSKIINKIIDAYPKVRSRVEAERCVSLAIANDAKTSGDDGKSCALRLLKRIEWFASIVKNPAYIPDMANFFYDEQYLCTDDQLRVVAQVISDNKEADDDWLARAKKRDYHAERMATEAQDDGILRENLKRMGIEL